MKAGTIRYLSIYPVIFGMAGAGANLIVEISFHATQVAIILVGIGVLMISAASIFDDIDQK